MPLDMAVSGNGKTLYVTAFGSSRIGVFDTAALEKQHLRSRYRERELSFRQRWRAQRSSADEARNRLYVADALRRLGGMK